MRKSILLLVVSAILAMGSITLLCITLLWPVDEPQQEEPIQNWTPPFEELIGSLEEKAEEDESTDTLPTPDKIFLYAVLQESYSDQESYDKDVRESWKRLGEVLCQVAEQPTVNVYGWREAMYQFKKRTEELAAVAHWRLCRKTSFFMSLPTRSSTDMKALMRTTTIGSIFWCTE